MKVLLRDKHTGRYYQSPTQWTIHQGEALDFGLVQTATAQVADSKVKDVEVVLSFADPPQDIVLGPNEREVLPRTTAGSPHASISLAKS